MDTKCLMCNRKLIEFRKLTKQDWKSRKYHTTCWIKKRENDELQEMLKKFQSKN
jgi:hypothetical protein